MLNRVGGPTFLSGMMLLVLTALAASAGLESRLDELMEVETQKTFAQIEQQYREQLPIWSVTLVRTVEPWHGATPTAWSHFGMSAPGATGQR